MKVLFLFTLFIVTLYAKDFSVASYNVENLFDLKNDHTEYKEFIPYQNGWNEKNLQLKLQNIAQVINDINADIIALQEVESEKALNLLRQKTPQYEYSDFIKNPSSAIGLAILSKYPIIKREHINILSNSSTARPLQKVSFLIDNHPFIVINNHWSSKKAAESKRIEYALSLQKHLEMQLGHSDYILVGDFNSNYNEYLTFKHNKRLNDSYNITGINQIINTTLNQKFIEKQNILSHKEKVHYNLWLELPLYQRASYIFKQENETPDNIILSASLFDDLNISYVHNSFHSFTKPYLFKKNMPFRWQMKQGKHLGEGYSDHLPIIATFSTQKQPKYQPKLTENSIDYLYTITQLSNDLPLKKVKVIYKENNNAIIKQNNRAVFLYQCAQNLKEGYVYDILIQDIENYFGLKEIKKIQILKEYEQDTYYKNDYLNANTIDLFNFKYQNEIITQLTGVFENGYLKFNNQKIKLYAKQKALLPKNGQNITIISGHLGYYKSNIQIILYKKSDIRVN